jgi:hypothetical protein
MAHDAQRPNTSRPAGFVNGVEGRGEGTDVISSGTLHVSDDIYPNRAQAPNGNIDLCIVILLLERACDVGPGLLQGKTGNNERPCFRERDLTLAVNHTSEVLGDTSPKIDGEGIACTKYIVGPDGQIDRQRPVSHSPVCGIITVDEDLRTEALELNAIRRDLSVEISQRAQIVWRG